MKSYKKQHIANGLCSNGDGRPLAQHSKVRCAECFEKHFWTMVKNKYGLVPDDYFAMWISQGGKCPVCATNIGFRDTNTHVDHDHSNGRVRALLCGECNRVEGVVKKHGIKKILLVWGYQLENDERVLERRDAATKAGGRAGKQQLSLFMQEGSEGGDLGRSEETTAESAGGIDGNGEGRGG